MNHAPNNAAGSPLSPIDPLPEGLSEADVLDLVEGALAPDRRARVSAIIGQNPKLAQLVTRLEQDKVGLIAQARADALAGPPAGFAALEQHICDHIESALSEQALATLAQAEMEATPEAGVPEPALAMAETSALVRFVESRWARRLATAASLAVVGGLAIMLGRTLLNSPGTPRSTPVAVNSPGSTGAPGTDATTPNTQGTGTDALASGHQADTPGDTVSPGADPHTASVLAMGEHSALDATSATDTTDAAIISPARAAELAGQGRLAVAVVTLDGPRTRKRLDALAKADARQGGWRSLDVAAPPAPLATLASTLPFDERAEREIGGVPNTVVVIAADGQPQIQVRTPGATTPSITSPSVALPSAPTVLAPVALYTVDVDTSPQAMTDLLVAVREPTTSTSADSTTRSVRFVELPEPVAPAITTEPESVLWWTGPASRWVKRVSVPVIVRTPR